MWFVFDENGNCVAKGMTELQARTLARKINGKAVWNC